MPDKQICVVCSGVAGRGARDGQRFITIGNDVELEKELSDKTEVYGRNTDTGKYLSHYIPTGYLFCPKCGLMYKEIE